MFIRIKKIKGKKYCYKVQNEWTSKGSRQKVTGYLGKLVKMEPEKEMGYSEQEDVLKQVYEKNLFALGFKKKGDQWNKGQIVVNIEEKTVRQGKSKIVIGSNEGFICDDTISELINYVPGDGKTEEELGEELAGKLLEAGLLIEHEDFVAIFEKLFKNKKFFPGNTIKG